MPGIALVGEEGSAAEAERVISPEAEWIMSLDTLYPDLLSLLVRPVTRPVPRITGPGLGIHIGRGGDGMTRTDPEVGQVWEHFHRMVNMPSPELRDWLVAAPDGADAYSPEPGLDVHEVGERVLRLLDKRRGDLSPDDVSTMRTVAELICGRLLNPPDEDAAYGPWRHTLMMMGHDPLRPDSPRGVDAEAAIGR
jgi:hypothetical protein